MSFRFAPAALPLLLAPLFAPTLYAQQVACEKFQLANGLTVILHEDHAVPSVAINTWFHVGAKDEPPRRSGFAHLFEHLMFMGTERVPGSRFDEVMEAGGGSNNASTTEDRTNYFSNGPASLLPTLLWLDADRFEDVGRTMDQQKLDRQREVVRNEIRQQVEGRPYGRIERTTFHLLFPAGHPYHEGTYGSHADLEAATVDDVRDFFATYYVPANASLAIVGDFDAAQVRPLVEQLFGSLPKAPEPVRRVPPPVGLDRVVRTTLLDRVQLPLVHMAWHAPADASEGSAELDLLAELLASGKDSRLYRRLVVDERLAVEVDASYDGLALGGLFTVDVYANPGADLDRVEAVVDEVLAAAREQPFAADELARRQTAREVGQLAALQNIGFIADRLNRYEYLWGEPDSFARDLARYRAVQPASLQQVAARVLDPQRRAIVRVLPMAPERAASARDQRPADFATAAWREQVPTEFRLANGLRVLHWQRPELPIESLRLLVRPAASLVDAANAGAAALAADLLSEGAGDLDAARLAAELARLGARAKAWVDHESGNASLFVLARNFAPAVHLFATALQHPHLGEADFARAHALRLGRLQSDAESPWTIASRVALRTLFGDDDPYAWPAGGAVESFAKIDRAMVERAFANTFDATRATLLVAGALSADEVRTVLDAELGGWHSAAAAGTRSRPANVAPSPQPARLVVVDRPDAPQTTIQLVAPAPAYGDAGRVRRNLLGMALGGTFTSRLNQNLREQHGYTYGARASFSAGPWRGWFVAQTSVETSVTGASLKELFAELARLRATGGGDLSPDEVAKVQKTQRADAAEARGSLDGLLGEHVELVLEGVPIDQTGRDLATAAALTAADLNAASRGDIDLEHAVLVLVGDRARILAQLGDAGLPAGLVREFRDATGALVPAPDATTGAAKETAR